MRISKRVWLWTSVLTVLLAASSAPGQGYDPLYQEMKSRSIPADPENTSLFNPWGERLRVLNSIPWDFSSRVLAAAEVYKDQKIRFDGYLGSDDDGMNYRRAADGVDLAVYGDSQAKAYYEVRNNEVDDVRERVWVCPDYPVHVLTLAGFPLRQAMAADWNEDNGDYTNNGNFKANRPIDHWFFRRVQNLRTYLERRQLYWEERITRDQYFNPAFRPKEPFRPGDVVIMGHYGDTDGLGPWWPKHSGIIGSVDARGLPERIYNMRVSSNLVDHYDSVINHTREIDGQPAFFRRFCDRYSLIGHGRIVNAYEPPAFYTPAAIPDVARSSESIGESRFVIGMEPAESMQW